MIFSPRTALLVFAALSASSVAPAQVTTPEPLIEMSSVTLPKVATPQLLTNEPVLTNTTTETDNSADADQGDLATVDRGQSLSDMVADLRAQEAGSRELECLATGIYFESKSEPLAGQLAVGQVIANRAESKRYPSTYCGVILQRGQFSFVRGHRLPRVPHTSKQWQTAVAIAKIVDRDLKDSAVGDALFFHARRVSPNWNRARVALIGNHIFYR
jgi:N-acetylmuramoyl-L-alanine amidase